MTAREGLLGSLAATITDYRLGEIEPPTPELVDKWVCQFPADTQLPLLSELAHILDRTYVSQQAMESFMDDVLRDPGLVEGDPSGFWAGTCLLDVQHRGQSQADMLRLFAERLGPVVGLSAEECTGSGTRFVYLDDALFTGRRIVEDLTAWIGSDAPPSADVHVIVYASHSSGRFESKRALDTAATSAGKSIRFRYKVAREYETRKANRNASGVLWPAQLPDDASLNAYLDLPSRYPFVPREIGGDLGPFSSETGRLLLEEQFTVAGARIRAGHTAPLPQMRPLGFGNYGLGVGSMVVTYRNCPNNAPLALWWGVNQWWTPLLPRRVNDGAPRTTTATPQTDGPSSIEFDDLPL